MISTTHNINDFKNQFKSINQQVIETSVEEIIYENFINFNIMFTNLNIQIAIDVVINVEMKRVLTQMQKMFNNIIKQQKQQKSSNLLKSSNELKSNDIEIDDNTFK